MSARIMRSRLLVVIWLYVLAPIAWADVSEAMKLPVESNALAHYTHGNKLYRLRDFKSALAEYKAGAMIEPAPVFDYNLGQCYRQLGKYIEAIWHYERFLKVGEPDDQRRVLITAFLSQMRAELDRRVMTQPTESAPTMPEIKVLPVPINAARRPWYEDTFGWGLTGSGAITLVVSGMVYFSASKLITQANAEPNQRFQEELRDNAGRRQLVATVIAVGGTALTVTGLLKLIVNSDDAHSRLSLGISTNSLTLAAVF